MAGVGVEHPVMDFLVHALSVTSGPAAPEDIAKLLGHAIEAEGFALVRAGVPRRERMPDDAQVSVVDDIDAGSLMSDVLQADEAILWDRRGTGRAQLTVYGLAVGEAVEVMRSCAVDLARAGGAAGGFRIERTERNMDGFMAPEVEFAVIEVESGDAVTKPRAWQDGRAGEWTVVPGSQVSRCEPAEARARAAALLMAADEVERRNAS